MPAHPRIQAQQRGVLACQLQGLRRQVGTMHPRGGHLAGHGQREIAAAAAHVDATGLVERVGGIAQQVPRRLAQHLRLAPRDQRARPGQQVQAHESLALQQVGQGFAGEPARDQRVQTLQPRGIQRRRRMLLRRLHRQLKARGAAPQRTQRGFGCLLGLVGQGAQRRPQAAQALQGLRSAEIHAPAPWPSASMRNAGQCR